MSENVNITEAKKSLKHHVKFFQSLLAHIKKGEEPFMSRSMFAAWCIDKYLNEQLKNDIKKAIKENGI